jgi:hypothetical protein
MSNRDEVVELTRVQPFEAQVIVAKLRAEGIEASLSPDASPYDSISQADGVSVFVSTADAPRAHAVLEDTDPDASVP